MTTMTKGLIFSIFSFILMLGIVSCGNDRPGSDTSKKNPKKYPKKTAAKDNKNSSEDVKQVVIPAAELAKAKELIASVSEKDLKDINGKKVFKTYCSLCHGIKGNMKINGATDLTKSTASLESSVAQVYHGRGMMTPFKGVLEDAEIVAVSKYLEELR